MKTGTSKDMRDNWCVGYSSEFTVGVWVGNFGGQPMWNVSGISGAAPVWLEIMNYLHRTRKSAPPVPPKGVARRKVQLAGGDVKEWFISGTGPAPEAGYANGQTEEQGNGAAFDPKIIYPVDGEFIALDPDIPPSSQKVFFEANAAGQWLLDGKPLGKGNMLPWAPVKGHHEISLMEGSREEDKVSFAVR